MSSVDYKRQKLLKAYPGRKWALKVKNMDEAMVVATYLNLKKQQKV